MQVAGPPGLECGWFTPGVGRWRWSAGRTPGAPAGGVGLRDGPPGLPARVVGPRAPGLRRWRWSARRTPGASGACHWTTGSRRCGTRRGTAPAAAPDSRSMVGKATAAVPHLQVPVFIARRPLTGPPPTRHPPSGPPPTGPPPTRPPPTYATPRATQSRWSSSMALSGCSGSESSAPAASRRSAIVASRASSANRPSQRTAARS
jgi:hypothetical protein